MADVAAPAATADHLLLFNRDAFHALNLRPAQRVVRVDHHDGGRLVGSLVGVRDGDVVTCGHSAPFGGPDLVRDAETAPNVVALLEAAVAELEADGVREIRVRARPAFYSGSETTVQFALLNAGFRVEACELGLHIDLEPLGGIDDYVAGLRSPARRALRHGLAEPFALREAAAGDPWDAGYDLLAANRAAKGRRLALDAAYVRAARDAFPGRIRMALLEHAGAPCAAALTYRVLPGRELVVYWGDAGHALPRSPMNVLAHALVARSLGEGVRSLDIGPSSVDGVPDGGLIQFKRSIGAREDLRLHLVREAA
ncbi:MAG TPA: GNAT family N-acetyltransferase [Miltoncostaeaceae bacterium]|nr:GNAT family N-acetyltransferase [Miltoncostaeaceae bacterium]